MEGERFEVALTQPLDRPWRWGVPTWVVITALGFVMTIDGDSVVPGLIISALVAVFLVVTAWFGLRRTTLRHRLVVAAG